jgi:serine/threonine protein kinase
MSPEQMQGKPYSFESDIWALGTVLHELCALKSPFLAENMQKLKLAVIRNSPSAIPSHFSHRLRSLVASMLEKFSARRPTIGTVAPVPAACLCAILATRTKADTQRK